MQQNAFIILKCWCFCFHVSEEFRKLCTVTGLVPRRPDLPPSHPDGTIPIVIPPGPVPPAIYPPVLPGVLQPALPRPDIAFPSRAPPPHGKS